jgi:hypothetical protein
MLNNNHPTLVSETTQHTLAAALGDVLVLQLLRVGEVVVLVKERRDVARVDLLVRRPDNPDPAPSHVREPHVETPAVTSCKESGALAKTRAPCNSYGRQ